MRSLFFLSSLLLSSFIQAQPVLKTGDLFPDMVFRNVLNAPVRELEAHMRTTKFTILNFWGTWCPPCLPEMDSLARLQARNNARIQVIAISNESTDRLQRYLARKPSGIWLVSDTISWLYRQFGFNYVGQSAILDQQHRIIALVRTDSINQQLIDKLARKEPIPHSAETGNKLAIAEDPFSIDSTLESQVLFSGYRPGLSGMRKFYPEGPFAGRRLTYVNSCARYMLIDAYKVTHQQVVFEIPEKQVCNDADQKNTQYCFDLLVKPGQKDSLLIIMQQYLRQLLPVKTRLEKRSLPVYVLRRISGAPAWQESSATKPVYSWGGWGFEGKRIALSDFVDYLSNELHLPVVDETELTGKYDITTNNVMRTTDEVLANLKRLGLSIEKTTRSLDVVVVY